VREEGPRDGRLAFSAVLRLSNRRVQLQPCARAVFQLHSEGHAVFRCVDVSDIKVRPQDAHIFMTAAMPKIFGVIICLFAMIRLVSHPAAQNRVIDYVLMAVMFACGIYLFFAKKPQGSDKK